VGVIPVRLPEALERAVDRVAAQDGLDRSTALRRLLSLGLDHYVAQRYAVGEVSLREAAEWLGVTLREAMDRLEAAGAAGNLTLDEVKAALTDLRSQP
jgi:predicted HTH domain antitoxin